MAEFSHNSAPHSSTGKSTFSLILRYKLHSYPPISKTFLPTLETRLSDLGEAQQEALAAHEKAQRTMREQISFKFCPWKMEDKVWLEGWNLKLWSPSRKLASRWEGPFEIAQIVSPVAFRLRLLPTWRIPNVFHASLLLFHKETLEHSPNFTNPPWWPYWRGKGELDKILSHRGAQGRRQYLVSWKGYSTVENTWESEENLKHVQAILRVYKLFHPKNFPSPHSSL